MGRFLWSQLVHRRSRTATLGLGILVAAVSFTLLTSAADTSALEVRGTIAKNWRTAYDVLVRPPGSYAPLERRESLVRENYLSGIFGGITMRQWREILDIPGVEVAAPIQNIGYIMPWWFVPIRINRYLTDDPVQLFRLRLSWSANGGLSRYPEGEQYVYYTTRYRFVYFADPKGVLHQVTPGHPFPLPICGTFFGEAPRGPFDLRGRTSLWCWSRRSPDAAQHLTDVRYPEGMVGGIWGAFFPLVLAAIDPAQENALLDLDGTVISGRPLGDGEGITIGTRRSKRYTTKYRYAPILASMRNYVDEILHSSVERLQIRRGVDVAALLASEDGRRFLRALPGTPLGKIRFPLGPIYQEMLEQLTGPAPEISYSIYWTTSPVGYQDLGGDRLSPLPVRNDPYKTFVEQFSGFLPAPYSNRDIQFRRLTSYRGSNVIHSGIGDLPGLKVVGRFDPEKLPGFSPLSRVPLETYYPPRVEAADAQTRKLLEGRPLLPTQNVGGYIAQPPLMLTTLKAARVFTNSQFFYGANDDEPISVIRVKVAGVTGPDRVSRERVRRVAELIQRQTGLAVDITVGSSPTAKLVQLPEGKFGQPSLLVREGWVKKGVALAILTALDRKSLALFVLILVVTGLFLVNGALASVRARRREIGTLLALGWTQGQIFRAVLGELAFLGLVGGAAGTVIAALLVRALSLEMPLARTLLVAPVAVVLAMLAGLLPAWRAARSIPLDAVRPVVAERGLGRSVRRIGGMALANVRRVPGRTLLAAGALFIGVAALALLLSINLAFQGTLVGTALGQFISVQIRGVDYLGVGFAVALGAVSVADVLFLNVRERAPELVTLRATGWGDRHLAEVVALEGLAIGVLGSVIGAGAGVSLSALVGAPAASVALAAGLAALAGAGVALLASLVPAGLISRLAPPAVLAEE